VQPIVVEGELVLIRHPARDQFPAVVELELREAFGCCCCRRAVATAR